MLYKPLIQFNILPSTNHHIHCSFDHCSDILCCANHCIHCSITVIYYTVQPIAPTAISQGYIVQHKAPSQWYNATNHCIHCSIATFLHGITFFKYIDQWWTVRHFSIHIKLLDTWCGGCANKKEKIYKRCWFCNITRNSKAVLHQWYQLKNRNAILTFDMHSHHNYQPWISYMYTHLVCWPRDVNLIN